MGIEKTYFSIVLEPNCTLCAWNRGFKLSNKIFTPEFVGSDKVWILSVTVRPCKINIRNTALETTAETGFPKISYTPVAAQRK